NLSHVDLFVLDVVFFAQAELYVKRYRKGDALADTLDLGRLGVAYSVGNELEHQAPVVALDREYLAKHCLQTIIFALRDRSVLLQEVEIGIDLNLDQVGRSDDVREFSEIDAVGHEILCF